MSDPCGRPHVHGTRNTHTQSIGKRIQNVSTHGLNGDNSILGTSEQSIDPHSGPGDKHHPWIYTGRAIPLPTAPDRHRCALLGESAPVEFWTTDTLDHSSRPALRHDVIPSRQRRADGAHVLFTHNKSATLFLIINGPSRISSTSHSVRGAAPFS